MRSTLPARSPTVVLICPSAMRIRTIYDKQMQRIHVFPALCPGVRRQAVRRAFLVTAVLLIGAAACAAEVRAGRFQNRDAWIVSGPKLHVTITQSGGHVAEIVLGEGKVNPLWIPSTPTIDPENYDPAKHKIYGASS